MIAPTEILLNNDALMHGVAILAGLAAFFTSLANLLSNRRASKKSEESYERNHEAIREVRISIDGRMDEFLALTRTAAKAEGVKQEKEASFDLRNEQK